jgi:hypothetical protein
LVLKLQQGNREGQSELTLLISIKQQFTSTEQKGTTMKALQIAAAATLLTLAACGGSGDDKLGDQAADVADAKADQMDAAADTTTGAQKDALEAQADATREAGEAREEAIDDADVNANAMTDAQKKAVAEGQ